MSGVGAEPARPRRWHAGVCDSPGPHASPRDGRNASATSEQSPISVVVRAAQLIGNERGPDDLPLSYSHY